VHFVTAILSARALALILAFNPLSLLLQLLVDEIRPLLLMLLLLRLLLQIVVPVLLEVPERVLNLLAGDLVELARPIARPAPAGPPELLVVRELARPIALEFKAGRPPLGSGLLLPLLLNLILFVRPLLLLLLLLVLLLLRLEEILHRVPIRGLLLLYLCLEQQGLRLLPAVLFKLLGVGARLMLPLTGARAAPRHYVLGAAGARGELILYVETNAFGRRIICPRLNVDLRGGGTCFDLLLRDLVLARRLPLRISSGIVMDLDKSSLRVALGSPGLQELGPRWV
jgi:hypothetical protein